MVGEGEGTEVMMLDGNTGWVKGEPSNDKVEESGERLKGALWPGLSSICADFYRKRIRVKTKSTTHKQGKNSQLRQREMLAVPSVLPVLAPLAFLHSLTAKHLLELERVVEHEEISLELPENAEIQS